MHCASVQGEVSFRKSCTKAIHEITVALDPDSEAVIRPFMVGRDVNREVEQRPTRWIIDFGTMEKAEAERFGGAFQHVQRVVYPVQKDNRREAYAKNWWRFVEARRGLRAAIVGLAPMGEAERHDLLEILEDRNGLRATIVTSQVPVANWHDTIGDPTIADAKRWHYFDIVDARNDADAIVSVGRSGPTAKFEITLSAILLPAPQAQAATLTDATPGAVTAS